jgi:hypothetical protein
MSQEVVSYESNADTRIRSGPGRRRRVVVLVTAVVTVTALFVAWRSLPVLIRDGAVWARIEIDVRDAGTGRPVPGASVTVLDSFGAALPPNVSLATPTDAAGRATARVLAGMGSADRFVYARVHFTTSGESVRITNPGYAPATAPLPRDGSTWRLLGGRIDAVLRVQVDLTPAPATRPGA